MIGNVKSMAFNVALGESVCGSLLEGAFEI